MTSTFSVGTPAGAAPFNVAVGRDAPDGAVSVRVTGEIDMSTAPNLRRALLDAVAQASADVVVDLSGVGFLDSTGLSALVAARNRGIEAGVEIVLESPPLRVMEVLEMSGLATVFRFSS